MSRPVPPPSAHQLTAGLIAAGVVVMAVIAGRHLRGPWDIDLHGHIGNAVFALALVNLVIAVLRRSAATVAVVLVVLIFAQTGLGYVGRENLDAAAWHIPLGVVIMGLAGFHLAEVRAVVRD